MSTRHPRRTATSALAIALVATLSLCGCVAATPRDHEATASADPPDVAIRVDQVGYGIGESKVAYAMGRDDALDQARFTVVDDRGETVRTGDLGDDTGAWNDDYTSVRTIDLTGLDDAGTYTLEVSGADRPMRSAPFRIAPVSELVRPLADLAVRFFQAQRDGADVVPTVLDRRPSHLLDRTATVYETPEYDDDGTTLTTERLVPAGRGTVDVSGGWFDAGDFLKFTGTTAYATAQLLLAGRESGWSDRAALDAETDVGVDWLSRMWDPASQTLLLQVGIGNGNEHIRTDHDVWRLPEADDRSPASSGDPDFTIAHRPVFAANDPGDALPPAVAGRVAAVFALDAQRAAAGGDDEGARTRLETGARILSLADTAPDDPRALGTAVPAEFYPEDSWQDDLEFAAVELAVAGRAIGDARSADWQRQAAGWAMRYIDSDTTGSLGVADVSALAHSDLIALGDPASPALVSDLRRQLDAGVEHAASDPFRAGASALDFDSVPFTFGLVATAALYERATGDSSYRAFAASQRGWVFGANAWGASFMIGAGSAYPRCPEHQVANLTEGAGELSGAVVNGPNATAELEELNRFETMRPCAADSSDGVPYSAFDGRGSRYLDDVGAWKTVEPSLDFTATALLALTLAGNSAAIRDGESPSPAADSTGHYGDDSLCMR